MLTESPQRPKPQQDAKGRFVPGNSGNGGRPRGSRNQLGEALLADLCADWCEHGAEAVRRVREERPSEYLKVVALLVSKGDMDNAVTVNVTHAHDLEQFIEERRQQALAMIAKMRGEPSPSDPAGKPGEGPGAA
jgi:hypothetical protein